MVTRVTIPSERATVMGMSRAIGTIGWLLRLPSKDQSRPMYNRPFTFARPDGEVWSWATEGHYVAWVKTDDPLCRRPTDDKDPPPNTNHFIPCLDGIPSKTIDLESWVSWLIILNAEKPKGQRDWLCRCGIGGVVFDAALLGHVFTGALPKHEDSINMTLFIPYPYKARGNHYGRLLVQGEQWGVCIMSMYGTPDPEHSVFINSLPTVEE